MNEPTGMAPGWERRAAVLLIAGLVIILVYVVLLWSVFLLVPWLALASLANVAVGWVADAYQRVALVLARKLYLPRLHGVITPVWVGVVGWVTTLIGLLLLVLAGLQVGWLLSIGLAVTGYFASLSLPLPQTFFLGRIRIRFTRLASQSNAAADRVALYSLIAAAASKAAEDATIWGWA